MDYQLRVNLHPWLTFPKMENFLCKVADLQIYSECTHTALWSVLVALRAQQMDCLQAAIQAYVVCLGLHLVSYQNIPNDIQSSHR